MAKSFRELDKNASSFFYLQNQQVTVLHLSVHILMLLYKFFCDIIYKGINYWRKIKMSLNDTPKGERVHIALFGKRNAGKSSIINKIMNQNLSIVSEIKGTTTDPVYKAMELLPVGPVMMIDTPGLDDEGTLGKMRVEKTIQVLNKTDVAVLAMDIKEGFTSFEAELAAEIKKRKIPCVIVLNKIDLYDNDEKIIQDYIKENTGFPVVCASVMQNKGIDIIKETIIKLVADTDEKNQIAGDLLNPSDIVVLVVPIDKAAPKGRLILPQQQTIRDILEADAIAVVTKEHEFKETLKSLGRKPKLVITDSQVFSEVSEDTPEDIMLTSFSILFARYKGNLEELVKGAKAVDMLQDGDVVLMAEGCTHHRQCDDIGTVKLPKWILKYTGKKVEFRNVSGTEFPKDLSEYKMIVHCGGCTLNKKEMRYRISVAKEQEIPIVNYGILIAYMKGILKRSIEPFGDIAESLLKKEI